MQNASGQVINLDSVDNERDLGVVVDKQLKFHCHTKAQVSKANQALGLIKQTISSVYSLVVKKLYPALVCLHLEFGYPVSNSSYKSDIGLLEGDLLNYQLHIEI